MNTVEPIRDQRKVDAIRAMLKGQDNPRDYLLFTLGVNTALRVGDLLKLNVGDVVDSQGKIVDSLNLREQKTNKEITVELNPLTKQAIEYYLSKSPPEATQHDMPLFKSKRSNKRLDRRVVWELISTWCKDVGLKGKYGSHSLRKTWGYHARTKACVPLEMIQATLGHSTPAVTRRYIGISADEIKAVRLKVQI